MCSAGPTVTNLAHNIATSSFPLLYKWDINNNRSRSSSSSNIGIGMEREAKKVWGGVATRLGSRKNGLKNLRRDVSTCEYEDVRIMWDMLINGNAAEMDEQRSSTTEMKTKKGRNVWELLACSSPKKAAS